MSSDFIAFISPRIWPHLAADLAYLAADLAHLAADLVHLAVDPTLHRAHLTVQYTHRLVEILLGRWLAHLSLSLRGPCDRGKILVVRSGPRPRFVDPNRSLLEARQLDIQTRPAWLAHLGEIWEEIVRTSIPIVLIDDAGGSPPRPGGRGPARTPRGAPRR